jgi:hypothetical protein
MEGRHVRRGFLTQQAISTDLQSFPGWLHLTSTCTLFCFTCIPSRRSPSHRSLLVLVIACTQSLVGLLPPIPAHTPPKTLSPQHHGRNSGFDVMASPAAANPASLLWAQQLKRENSNLLARMDELEAQQRACDVRVKSAETAADIARATDRKFKDLSGRVDAICDDEKNQKDLFDRIVGENHARMEKASETWRKTQQKVSTLDTHYRGMQEDMQRSSSNYDSAVRSIEVIQATLRQLQATADSLHQAAPRDDSALMHRLDALESHRSEEANQTRRMHDKVASLERTCQTVTARNSDLQAEVHRLRAVIETKAQVLPTTERFPQPTARTQTPTSLVSNEKYGSNTRSVPCPTDFFRAHFNSLVDSPSYNAQQRRLSVLTHSSQQNAQVPTFLLRTEQASTQTPGPDTPPPPSAAQRREGSTGAVKKTQVSTLEKIKSNTIKKLQASGGGREKQYPIKVPKTSKLQDATSVRATHNQAADTQSNDPTGTPSSRTTRSQAKNNHLTESLRTPSNSLTRIQGQNAQVGASAGPPSIPTSHGRATKIQVTGSLETSSTHTKRSRAKKIEDISPPKTLSVCSTSKRAKQAGRKKSMSAQPTRISDTISPQEHSRNTVSAKPSRVSALKRPPRNYQSSPGPSLVKVVLGKACDSCRKRKVSTTNKSSGRIHSNFLVG